MKNSLILSIAAGILGLWTLSLGYAIGHDISLVQGIMFICSMKSPVSWLFALCLLFLPKAFESKQVARIFRSKRPMPTLRINAADLFDFPHKEPEPVEEKETLTLIEPPTHHQRDDIGKLNPRRGQFDRRRDERSSY